MPLGLSSALYALRMALFLSLLLVDLSTSAHAGTLCVNQSGVHGCYSMISAAVAAANKGDTIAVAAGTYSEQVVIGKSLSLLGSGAGSSIIDGRGLANGVFVDGIDHPGLSTVVVSGFTVENAMFEGILVASATDVTIKDNQVTQNDEALTLETAMPSCPGLPPFETNEAIDCGEGVHLIGVDHSLIADNTIMNNSGGILLPDETGPTHENLLSGNRVKQNSLDCGIILASHPPSSGAAVSFGVFRNTISGNESGENGPENCGGAGVGIFAPGSGNKAYENLILNAEPPR